MVLYNFIPLLFVQDYNFILEHKTLFAFCNHDNGWITGYIPGHKYSNHPTTASLDPPKASAHRDMNTTTKFRIPADNYCQYCPTTVTTNRGCTPSMVSHATNRP